MVVGLEGLAGACCSVEVVLQDASGLFFGGGVVE
jgi:hypothetical protein